MRQGLSGAAGVSALDTAPPSPIMEPEVARAQVIDALHAWVRVGEAGWLNIDRTMIALSDGSRWRLDATTLTRLD